MTKYYKLQTKIPAVIILLLVSLVTFAQKSDNWRLATWTDESAFYYDPNRITRPKANFVRAWIRIEKNWKTKQIEKTVKLAEYDCSERKSRTLQSTSYDSNDKVLNSISSEVSSWSFVIPDTIGEELLEILCFGKEDAQSSIDAQKDYDDARKYYDEAEKLADNKRFAEAVLLYNKAIALQPNYSFYHFGLSKALSELKQYDLAVFHANKAIKLFDSNILYLGYQNLGEIYEKQKKFDFAIQAYKRAINLKTDCISSCEFYVERLYEKLNRNLELLAFYEERLQVRPSDIELLLKLGDLQKKLNKTQAANITYNKALQFAKAKIASTNLEAKDYDQLADVYEKLGQTDNKIETYKQGIKLFPDNKWLRIGLANSLSATGRLIEAIEQYKIAINNSEDKENIAWLYSFLARDQEEAGQITDAIESLKKAVSLEPKLHYLLDLARLYKQNGDLELALQAIDKSLQLEPSASSYKLKAEILEAQGQIEKAKTSYQEAVKVCPKCVWAYIALGGFFIRQNDKVSAMKQYQILKSLNPKLAAELLKKINSTKF